MLAFLKAGLGVDSAADLHHIFLVDHGHASLVEGHLRSLISRLPVVKKAEVGVRSVQRV